MLHVVKRRCILVPVAVWRSPVVMPSEMEMWVAKPLPKSQWAIPKNVVVCPTFLPNVQENVRRAGGDPATLLTAMMLGVVTHLAHDALRNQSATVVLKKGHELLGEAGLSTKGERSTWASSWQLLIQERSQKLGAFGKAARVALAHTRNVLGRDAGRNASETHPAGGDGAQRKLPRAA